MAHSILNQNVDILLKKFKTDPKTGLSQYEVDQRLKQYGSNEVPEKRANPIKLFLKKFWGITAWMLELIIILSWILHRYLDLFIVSFLLVANAIISFAEEVLASQAIESLKKRLYIQAKVLRDGKWSLVSATTLVPGDIVSIKVGDFVPADIKVIFGSLTVDQSALTGESLPIDKNLNDPVYSGSIVRNGQALGLVVLTGASTYFGKTVQLVQTAAPKSHIEAVIASISKVLFSIVATIITLLVVTSLVYKNISLEILPLSLVLLLGAIPVALPAMFTVSMALGSKKLSIMHVLVARLNAIEDAATMSVLCIDKTGTLTLNELTVTHVRAFDTYTQADILAYGALASEEESLDPIDLAFIKAAKQQNLSLSSFTVKQFTPFDQATKRAEALIEKGKETFRVYKGALGPMSQSFGVSQEKNNQLVEDATEFAQRGYRTIAVARTTDGKPTIVGLVALEDPPRPESKQLLTELRNLGIAVKMLTGDALPIAKEIASKVDLKGTAINFSYYRDQIDKNAATAKKIILNNTIFAEIYPEDKYEVVKILQNQGDRVGMTGDGVNDAPALRQAEVGIAVSNATDVAKKAASVVLTKPGLYNIDKLIKIGRLVFQRVNTWVINKISRTVLKSGFIIIAFWITGNYIISSLEMLLLILMTDFMKLSLATDNERISKTPSYWDIPRINHEAFVLGIAMVLESLILFFFGLRYFHLQGHMLRTFSFEILFYFAILSIFVMRERGHFWDSMPSKTLLITISLDALASFSITTFGLLGFQPIPVKYTLTVIGYAVVFSLFINDLIKIRIHRRFS